MFFNKKSGLSKCFSGMVDIHSHIMPDIDNGAFSKSVSLQILSYYETLGVRRVIATPNVGVNYPNNNTALLREEFNKLKELYTGKIELSLGGEYMLDSSFEDHLKSRDLLTLFDNYLLVEMRRSDMLSDVIGLISDIINAGYVVVLAHPENYRNLGHADYVKLKRMGVLFQLNMLSVLGCYGDNRKTRAEYLLKKSLYDFVGSNIHSFNNYSKAITNGKVPISIVDSIDKLKQNKLLGVCAH